MRRELSHKHKVTEWKGVGGNSVNTKRHAWNPKPGMSGWEVECSGACKTWCSPQDSEGCLLKEVLV